MNFFSVFLYWSWAILVTSNSKEEPLHLHRKRLCWGLKVKFKVIPGTNWGLMDKSKQDLWLSHECDFFFCKRHEKAGKGVYICEPLGIDPDSANRIE